MIFWIAWFDPHNSGIKKTRGPQLRKHNVWIPRIKVSRPWSCGSKSLIPTIPG
jgi:hypothetical protein